MPRGQRGVRGTTMQASTKAPKAAEDKPSPTRQNSSDMRARIAAIEQENKRLTDKESMMKTRLGNLQRGKSAQEMMRILNRTEEVKKLLEELAQSSGAAGEQLKAEVAEATDKYERNKERLNLALTREREALLGGLEVHEQEIPEKQFKQEIRRLRFVLNTMVQRRATDDADANAPENINTETDDLVETDVEPTCKYAVGNKLKVFSKAQHRWLTDGRVVGVRDVAKGDAKGDFAIKVEFNQASQTEWFRENSRKIKFVYADSANEEDDLDKAVAAIDTAEPDMEDWADEQLETRLAALTKQLDKVKGLRGGVTGKLDSIFETNENVRIAQEREEAARAEKARLEEEARLAAERPAEPITYRTGRPVAQSDPVWVWDKSRKAWFKDGEITNMDEEERKFYVMYHKQGKYKWFKERSIYVRHTEDLPEDPEEQNLDPVYLARSNNEPLSRCGSLADEWTSSKKSMKSEGAGRDSKPETRRLSSGGMGISIKGAKRNSKLVNRDSINTAKSKKKESPEKLIQKEYKERLTDLFTEYEPAKVRQVTKLLKQYKKREHFFYARECRKHGEYPLARYYGT